VIRLLDGTRAYVHAVIDNFSRRILAFRVSGRFEVANTLAVLTEAVRGSREAWVDVNESPPMLVVEGGVENFNGSVDAFIADGVIRRVHALTELRFSNSLIEAFWRSMKHQWLFLNTLDTVTAVRRHVSFYVSAHNSQIPLRGRTPDEMYYGKGDNIPESLEAGKREAQQARLITNRATSCATCSGLQA
jgi:transposase InsO family protein